MIDENENITRALETMIGKKVMLQLYSGTSYVMRVKKVKNGFVSGPIYNWGWSSKKCWFHSRRKKLLWQKVKIADLEYYPGDLYFGV